MTCDLRQHSQQLQKQQFEISDSLALLRNLRNPMMNVAELDVNYQPSLGALLLRRDILRNVKPEACN